MKTKNDDMTRPPAAVKPTLTAEQRAYVAAKRAALDDAIAVGVKQARAGQFSTRTREELLAEARKRKTKR